RSTCPAKRAPRSRGAPPKARTATIIRRPRRRIGSPMRLARTAVGAVLVIAALTLTACGSDSSSDTTSMAASYVPAKTRGQYRAGTRQRTVMQWWKAVQSGDPPVVHRYYAPGMGPTLPSLQRELATASNQFTGIPTFHSAEIHGNRATLYF